MVEPSRRRTEEEADNSEQLLLLARPDLYNAWLILIRGEYLLHYVGSPFMAKPGAPSVFRPEKLSPGPSR